MENICHTLLGLTLARATRAERTPLATTALVVGANLPDVDLAWSMFRSTLVYFHAHRGVTHSIAGFAVLTLLLWLALLAAGSMAPSVRVRGPGAAATLLACAAAGVGSHVLLDAANSYGVRPFLPWDGRWVYGDLWAVVDPWLWLILGGAVFLSASARRRILRLGWIAAAPVAAVIVAFSTIVPLGVRAAWCAGLIVTLAIGRCVRPRRGMHAARAGAGLVAIYAMFCAVSHHAALRRVEGSAAALADGRMSVAAALPLPADPLHWEAVLASDESLRYGVIGAVGAGDAAAPWTILPRGFDLAPYAALGRTCAGAVLAEFFRFPCAAVEDDAEGGGAVLVVRDARYSREGRGFATFAAPLDESGDPRIDASQCPAGADPRPQALPE